MLKIDGIAEWRTSLPNAGQTTFSFTSAMAMAKKLGGGDLSKINLPSFINEPTTTLMKPAECAAF